MTKLVIPSSSYYRNKENTMFFLASPQSYGSKVNILDSHSFPEESQISKMSTIKVFSFSLTSQQLKNINLLEEFLDSDSNFVVIFDCSLLTYPEIGTLIKMFQNAILLCDKTCTGLAIVSHDLQLYEISHLLSDCLFVANTNWSEHEVSGFHQYIKRSARNVNIDNFRLLRLLRYLKGKISYIIRK